MDEDFERINQKMQEILRELNRLPEQFLKEAQQKAFERYGTGFMGFGGQQSSPDPYRILGLDSSASDEEVKKRYNERLRQFHPDKAGPGFEFHLQAVMAAYDLIKKDRGW